MNNWMANMNPGNWSNSFPSMNPLSPDSLKSSANNWSAVMNNFYGMVNNSMG